MGVPGGPGVESHLLTIGAPSLCSRHSREAPQALGELGMSGGREGCGGTPRVSVDAWPVAGGPVVVTP